MAFDDPIVWVLIIAVVVFLFGANKIPGLARSIGQAKREFDMVQKEAMNPSPTPVAPQNANSGGLLSQPSTTAPAPAPIASAESDPLVLAAQKEGIVTEGKTRDQIATELAWRLKSKSQ